MDKNHALSISRANDFNAYIDTAFANSEITKAE